MRDPAIIENNRMPLAHRKSDGTLTQGDSPRQKRPSSSSSGLGENAVGPYVMADQTGAMTRYGRRMESERQPRQRSVTPSRLRIGRSKQSPNPNQIPSKADPSPLRSRFLRRDSNSAFSQASESAGPLPPGATDWEWQPNSDPDEQEQALFEQRLCEDEYGVAVRKINQNGKSNLRYVKCIEVDIAELDDEGNGGISSNQSVGSRSSAFSFRKGFARFRSDRSVGRSDRSVDRDETKQENHLLRPTGTTVKVLTWGKKKDVKIPLERFVSVRKGKTTDRARRNICPSSKILSIITDDPYHPSLDIEAPTRLDRDKFARAFARFLNIPLEGDDNRSYRSDLTPQSRNDIQNIANQSPYSNQFRSTQGTNNSQNIRKNVPMPVVTTSSSKKIPSHKSSSREINFIARAKMARESKMKDNPDPQLLSLPSSTYLGSSPGSGSGRRQSAADADDASAVSSITGAAFDPEIVEELHTELATLRAELEQSRAEAARAVKVAEQAIQSAEKSDSKDWNSTVTKKAAEAAALAQKKSAEAMSRARLAEERLEAEQKNAATWKKQAQSAEEEAGYWQTRAAAAEVRKAGMIESWETERNKTAELLSSMKQEGNDSNQANESAMDRNRALEIELEIMRSTLANKNEEVIALQECFAELESSPEVSQILSKEKPGLMAKIKNTKSQDDTLLSMLPTLISSEKPQSEQVSQAVIASQSEIQRLRSKLAMESAARRKLLHEVQDLRGAVRVYCRPKLATNGVCTISVPSHEVVLLHRERAGSKDSRSPPLSFEFDGVLTPEIDQQELYGELEEVCLNVLDGYNICVMAFGQARAGKTHTMLGDVGYSIAAEGEPISSINNFGLHLRAAKQIFSVLRHRSQRFKDVVTFSLLEVNDDRISDLLSGTDVGESQGRLETRKGNRRRNDMASVTSSISQPPSKLEIKKNYNGETIIHGLLSVEVKSFEDICRVWKECLSKRVSRLAEEGLKLEDYDLNSHMIGTMRVYSTNLSTGVSTRGRIQFVDLASADLSPTKINASSKKALSPELKFSNKSITTLSEVIQARSQFQPAPYRNSTITHLLSDSLEGDAKVVMVACISSDPEDIKETTSTLKFAQAMRKVVVGKATKHTVVET